LILNRGFRVLARVAPIADGVLFEGLSTTWKILPNGQTEYSKLEPVMQAANLEVARSIRAWAEHLGFALWALDYADQPDLERHAKQRAKELGFVSFTSNWQLLKI
jgi:hypothetical protein